MSFVRTIQHPGVEIREIDMTDFQSTVTTNNTYIMGFCDKGPIYDYSWISNQSQFINTYGEPQTEAQKYLYNAVQSVLNNGGTPIVARMPYDNKQCKTYKGLKIKFTGTTGSTNDDTGSDSWISGGKAKEYLISLDTVITSLISSALTQDTFKDTSSIESIITMTDGSKISFDNAKTWFEYFNIGNMLCNLSPSLNNINILKTAGITYTPFLVNGYYPEGLEVPEIAITNTLNDINNNSNLSLYYYVSASIADNISAELNSMAITDKCSNLSGADLIINNISGATWYFNNVDTNYQADIETTNVSAWIPSSDFFNNPVIFKTLIEPANKEHGHDALYKATIDLNLLTNNSQEYTLSACVSPTLPGETAIYKNWLDIPNLSGMSEFIFDIEDTKNMPFINIKVPATATIQLNKTKTFEGSTQLSTLLIGTISGLVNDNSLNNSLNEKLTNSEELNSYLTLSGKQITNEFSFNENETEFFKKNGNPEIITGLLTGTYQGTDYNININITNYNVADISGYLNNNLSGIDTKHQFKNTNTFEKLSLVSISGTLNNETITNTTQYIVNSEYMYLKYLTCVLLTDKNVKPFNFDTGKIEGINSTQFENIVKSLKAIYNDPYFTEPDLHFDAAIDAALLKDKSIGYDYAVYIDSAEAEISNDQYDALVVANEFTAGNILEDKYSSDISNANYLIIDKTKSVASGEGNNIGTFVTIIDPFDGLKLQRLLSNPYQIPISNESKTNIKYWGETSTNNWKSIYQEQIDTLNALQRLKNSDGIWIGEESANKHAQNKFNTWATPLTGLYYDESISKSIMSLFPQIPLKSVSSKNINDASIIEKEYSSFVVIAVCTTYINPSDGKISISVIEQFFGSLFDENNLQTGTSYFIGDVINSKSQYIEFYRNKKVGSSGGGITTAACGSSGGSTSTVAQFYLKDSAALKEAATRAGIDTDYYDSNNYFNNDTNAILATGSLMQYTYDDFLKELKKHNIYIFDKNNTILYNNYPAAEFMSFSKKEAQKTIANTTGLYGEEQGTTLNIAGNFVTDMDRCINYIKNVDDIPLYFICDAGLSTIAQFCDNVIWDPIFNKWITQGFNPEEDSDAEDRDITDYTDITTWRKVVEKLDQISREIRKDCMTIVDAPRQLTLDGAAPKIRRSNPNANWDQVIGNKLKFITGLESSYTCGYYNWLRTTDVYTGKALWLPPTTKVIGNLVYLNSVNLPWLAPAGLSYGLITGVHAVSHNPSGTEEDQIYMKSWNYIRQYPFDGFVIEGNKTLLTSNSAFGRLNVRTLFLDLERYTYNVGRTFKYQVNNAYTREQFVQTLKVKFDDYKSRGGIYDYLIKCDESNNTVETIDAQELRCAIYVKPARLIEYILVNMVATKTGANLEEIANL